MGALTERFRSLAIATGNLLLRSAGGGKTISTAEELHDYLVQMNGGWTGGEAVGFNRAQSVATVYRCTNLNATSIASLPVELQKEDPSGRGFKRVTDRKHRLVRFLREPNTWQHRFELFNFAIQSKLLRGNFYGRRFTIGEKLMVRPYYADCVELDPMAPPEMRRYTYHDPILGRTINVPRDEMVHIRNPVGGDLVVGRSTLAYAADVISGAIAMQQSQTNLFRRGMHASGALEHPKKLSKEAQERLKESWEQNYHGPGNAGGTIVLEEGMKYTKLQMSAQDVQFVEQQQVTAHAICAFFGVPPHKVGLLNRSTNNNIETQEREYVIDTLMPLAINLELSLSRDLMSDEEFEEGYRFRFDFDARLRGEFLKRQQGLQIQRANGAININEWREREGMSPIEGGDDYVSAAYLYGDEQASPDDEEAPKEGNDDVVNEPGSKQRRGEVRHVVEIVVKHEPMKVEPKKESTVLEVERGPDGRVRRIKQG